MAKTLPTLATTSLLGNNDLFLTRLAGETVDKAIASSDLRLQILKAMNLLYRAEDYGAKFDGKMLTDVATTNGSDTVSSASYSFTSADVGKVALLKDSVTANTYRFRGTISSVSAGNAVLSSTIVTTQAAAVLEFGTDDTTAIQNAVNAANPEDYLGSGTWKYRYQGIVTFPAGISFTTSEIKIRPGVSFEGQGKHATRIIWAYTGDMGTADHYAMFHGGVANGSTRIYKDVQFRKMHIDMNAATNPGNGYHAKCVEIVYAVRLAAIENFFDGSPATSFGCDYVSGGIMYGNYFRNSGRLWTAGGGGGSGMDFQSYSANYVADNVLEGREHSIFAHNIFINPMVSAIRFTDNSSVNRAVNQALIVGNLIITNRTTTGKGIDDNASTGAIIIGNNVFNEATQTSAGSPAQHQWAGIQTTGGIYGAIVGNTVRGYYDGILIARGNSGIQPDTYLVANNNVAGAARHGIRIESDNTYTASRFNINGNTVSRCGASGIALTNTAGSAGNINNVSVVGNSLLDNGQTTATDADRSGIFINTPVSGFHVAANYIYDSGTAKQKYGITVDTVAVSDAFITGNHLSGNTTSAINLVSTGSISGSIVNNKGYQPGAASVSPGASPWTYTAGNTPEVVYISGGTVSGITKNSVAIPVGQPIYLNPGEQIVVTYSVAPTVVADKK